MVINDYKDKRSNLIITKYVRQCLKYQGTLMKLMKLKCNYILRDMNANYYTYTF